MAINRMMCKIIQFIYNKMYMIICITYLKNQIPQSQNLNVVHFELIMSQMVAICM